MMEGIFQTMLFFLGVRALLASKKEDNMGKRRKNKNKFKNNNNENMSTKLALREEKQKEKDQEPTPMHKRIEDVALPPPREAQKGII